MIEFPEFRTIEERVKEIQKKRADGIAGKTDEEEETEPDELDTVLNKHTDTPVERNIGKFISQYFIGGALKDKTPEEIRWMIDNDVIVPHRIIKGDGRLSSIIQNRVIPKGSKSVRPNWGDEKTQTAIIEWLSVVAPQTQEVDSELLNEWIRLQLDYVRLYILRKPPVEQHDALESIQRPHQLTQQGSTDLSDKLRSML